jgi:hypothetical protein
VTSHTPAADTTADPAWSAVTVTAHLTAPAIGIDTHPLHLDGPLSWGAYQQHITTHGHASLPHMDDEHATDFALPVAVWTRDGTWGWACSRAHYQPAGYTTTAMRRRPATEEMARYAPDAKHHLSAGPMKARDIPLPATLVDEVTWYALAEPEQLEALLNRVWSLGRLGRHGHGRIREWTVTPAADRDAWRDRVMPHPDGTMQGIRAPYHHPTRKVPAR